jgi:hypothetical protein
VRRSTLAKGGLKEATYRWDRIGCSTNEGEQDLIRTSSECIGSDLVEVCTKYFHQGVCKVDPPDSWWNQRYSMRESVQV